MQLQKNSLNLFLLFFTLEELNLSINPATYSVKHTLLDYERNEYAEYLRETNPEKYVNASNAQEALLEQINKYNEEYFLGTTTLTEEEINLIQEEYQFLDELVEITPNNIRLRKRILNKEERMKYEAKRK